MLHAGIENFDRGQISTVYPAPARLGTSRQGPAKTGLEMGDWKYDFLHSPAISDITTDVLWIEDVCLLGFAVGKKKT